MPRWLSKFFRHTYKNRTFDQQRMERGAAFGELKVRQRITLDAPVVCRRCNNGWMSELEDLAKPILVPLITHPHVPRSITAVECLTLASWLATKSVVVDFHNFTIGGQTTLFYKPQQRRSLRDRTVPPSLSTVWLGRMQKRRSGSGDFQTIYYSRLYVNPAFRHLKATITTMAINEVVIQLVAWRKMNARATIPDPIPWFHAPNIGTWDDYLTDIWPELPTSLEWPPNLMFQRGNFQSLAHRLVGFPPRK